jgi:hypothetical protein
MLDFLSAVFSASLLLTICIDPGIDCIDSMHTEKIEKQRNTIELRKTCLHPADKTKLKYPELKYPELKICRNYKEK